MYLYHYGLKELPFTLTPNTRLFCELPTFSEAISVINSAIECGEGFVKIIGEVGTGKTMLGNKVAQKIRENHPLIHITNSQISPEALYNKINKQLADQYKINPNKSEGELEALIKAVVERKNTLVILVDESQSLSHSTLEAIRFLSNIETESKKLVQIILLGQPEFDERLRSKELRQLNQRIAFNYNLHPLTKEEIKKYIDYRLDKVRYYPNSIEFDAAAISSLYKFSKGLPRKINVLCHRALMLGYADNTKLITKKHIVMAEKEGKPSKRSWKTAFLRFSLPSIMIMAMGATSWLTL